RGFTALLPNNLRVSVNNSELGLPLAMTVTQESSSVRRLFSFAYQYDEEDRVQVFTDSEFGARRYSYDAESQLLSVVADQPTSSETFRYDRAGNRTSWNGENATFDALNQLLSQGQARCSYDGRGNMTSFSRPEEAWQYTYNSQNLLVRAE